MFDKKKLIQISLKQHSKWKTCFMCVDVFTSLMQIYQLTKTLWRAYQLIRFMNCRNLHMEQVDRINELCINLSMRQVDQSS